jgi:HSP20 family molecular chaperone IbpA
MPWKEPTMARIDRRTETEQDEQRRKDEQRRMDEQRAMDEQRRAGRPEPGREQRRESSEEYRERRRRMERDQGAWPYAGPVSATGYRPPGYMGYPGYMSYPWSRFSHGMDPSYEDWQGPGFGTHTPGGWEPRVETFHRGGDLIVRVELPGWDKDEVNVFVEEEDLVVEGVREGDGGSEEDRRADERRLREAGESRSRSDWAERFSTRVSLPSAVVSDDLKAKFKNGVLEVKIPMPERRTERRTVKIDT